MTYDEARALPEEERKPGMKVQGKNAPFGGTWEYDFDADELTLLGETLEIGEGDKSC